MIQVAIKSDNNITCASPGIKNSKEVLGKSNFPISRIRRLIHHNGFLENRSPEIRLIFKSNIEGRCSCHIPSIAALKGLLDSIRIIAIKSKNRSSTSSAWISGSKEKFSGHHMSLTDRRWHILNADGFLKQRSPNIGFIFYANIEKSHSIG